MKTIKQIADEIGVTKQAVHQRMKRKPLSTLLKELTQTVDGVIYINVDGENTIKSAFSKIEPSTPSTESVDAFTQTFTPTVDSVTTDYINSLKEQISTLTADKEYSRTQVTNLQEELQKQSERIAALADKLAELTRNSQVLLKQEQDKTAFLLPDESQGSSNSSGEGENKKRGFWRFWKK